MIWDAAAAAAGAGCLLLAWRRAWLDAGGMGAAAAVGLGVWAGAGPPGVALLLLFFVTSALLTAWRGDPAEETRTARQVWANGGPVALCGLAGAAGLMSGAAWAVVGGVAAATADTWASEVGRAVGGTTWRLAGAERVPPGTPGGVSAAGTAAALAGAGAVGAGAALLLPGDPGRALAAALAAGAGAALLDSALRALRGDGGGEPPHDWGSDLVNAIATAGGAALGWAVAAAG